MKKLMCMTIFMFVCGGIISNDCCAKATIYNKRPAFANKETYAIAKNGFDSKIDEINTEEIAIFAGLKGLKFSNAEKKALLNDVKIILCKDNKSAEVKNIQSIIKKYLTAVANKHTSLFSKFDQALLKFKSQKAIKKQEKLVDANLDGLYEKSLFNLYQSACDNMTNETSEKLNSEHSVQLFIKGLPSASQEDYKLLFDLLEKEDKVYLAVLDFVARKKTQWINAIYKKDKISLKAHINRLRELIENSADNAYVKETEKFLSELEVFIVFEWFLQNTRVYNVTAAKFIASPTTGQQQDYSQENLTQTQTIVQQQPYYPQTMELPINDKQNAPVVSVNNTQKTKTISRSSSSRSTRSK